MNDQTSRVAPPIERSLSPVIFLKVALPLLLLYLLEPLAAAEPLLLLSYSEWLRHRSEALRRYFLYAVIVSIALTSVGAVLF